MSDTEWGMIEQFDGGGVVLREAFNKARAMAMEYSNSEEFLSRTKVMKEAYAFDHYSEAPWFGQLFKRDGTLKGREATIDKCWVDDVDKYHTTWRHNKSGDIVVTTIPGSFTSAESVLARAIDAGIGYEGMGKSAIEKKLKAKKEEVPLFEYVMGMAERLINKADQLGETEKTVVVDYIKERI